MHSRQQGLRASTTTVTRAGGLLLCLLGIVIVVLVSVLAYRVPTLRHDVPADEFSAVRARAELQTLVGDGIAHPIGSEANAHVRQGIVQRLATLGYETEIQTGFVCNAYATCGSPANIIARAPGRGGAGDEDTVLLAAHYDSVPAGPGAADDAAGVANVLEIARILMTKPPMRHPIAILISDGEEAGLLGAMLFVRDHPLARRIAAAVNLEARGTSGPSLMFETGSANAWLMSLYRRAIARPITDSVYYVAYKTMPNNTDFSVFKSEGWQGFNFAFIGDVAHYHTALDTVSNIDLRSMQQQGDNALASVRALAQSDELRLHPKGEAVYFDALSRFLIVWPARFSFVAASAVLALLLVEAVLLRRRGLVTLQQTAWGAAGALACLMLAGTVSVFMLWLLLKSGKVAPLTQYSWIAHPGGMHVACAALAATAAASASHWLAKRAGFWGFWVATMLLIAALGETLAAWRPGLGFAFLIAPAIGAIVVMPTLRRVPAGRFMELAAIAPAWAIFALLIPLMLLLYGALGSIAWVLDSLLLGFAATLLLPLLANSGRVFRQRIITVAGIVCVIAFVSTFALPSYSAAWPQRINFRYRLDANEHRAAWLVEPDSLRFPAFLSNAAPFDGDVRPPAGERSRVFEAPAAPIDLSPPTLTVLAAHASPDGTTHYDLHLQSMRGAPEVEVRFPSGAQIREVLVRERSGERRVPLYETADDRRLHLMGLEPRGMDFAVDVRGGALAVQVLDQSYSLANGEFLIRLRPPEATSSREGDTTVVQNTVTLEPAAGR